MNVCAMTLRPIDAANGVFAVRPRFARAREEEGRRDRAAIGCSGSGSLPLAMETRNGKTFETPATGDRPRFALR